MLLKLIYLNGVIFSQINLIQSIPVFQLTTFLRRVLTHFQLIFNALLTHFRRIKTRFYISNFFPTKFKSNKRIVRLYK
jgi:hypothetical protein